MLLRLLKFQNLGRFVYKLLIELFCDFGNFSKRAYFRRNEVFLVNISRKAIGKALDMISLKVY